MRQDVNGGELIVLFQNVRDLFDTVHVSLQEHDLQMPAVSLFILQVSYQVLVAVYRPVDECECGPLARRLCQRLLRVVGHRGIR